MEFLKAFEFQNLIAYLLPGLVGARAVAYYFKHLDAAYQKASVGGDGAVVPLLLLLLASLTTGLTISVLRQQFFDGFLGFCRGYGNAGRMRPGWRPNYSQILASPEKRAAYKDAIEQVYRYYQFISNMGLALLLLAAARFEVLELPGEHRITRGIVALASLLLIASVFQFIGWCRVHNQICKSSSRAELEEERTRAEVAAADPGASAIAGAESVTAHASTDAHP